MSELAINGGPAAISGYEAQGEPKLGTAELLSIARRFGYSEDALTRLAAAVSDTDLPPGGPHLGRWYGSASPSCGEQFEAAARAAFEVPYAFAACNGTSALHAAMVAVGAGPGKEVICPATGFLATSMAAALTGATPVFCDVDTSLQLDPTKLEALINERTVAVAPTHHWGFVADLEPIVTIAHRHGVKVVEDCAQAPGASYRGRPVGSVGDVGCFSISAYKIIGGGEGGMVVTSDERLYDRVRQAAEGGGLWRSDRFAPPRYEGELFVGGNYRLSELESAVNLVQMQKLPQVVGRHRAVWHRLRDQLGQWREITWQHSNDPAGDIGYMLRCFPATHELGHQLAAALRAEGLGVGYRGAGAAPDWHVARDMYPLLTTCGPACRAEQCPTAADLYDRCLSLGLNQWLTPNDVDMVGAALRKVLSACCTPA
ncbi:MAG: DegT/DnrJ/EryC1/StrS family aminotransferase [Fimbriimonadaceae bacterium]|nr:DegT/DnrJ/EryC1/StrS family aminotransferase [Fimbriimonadaceae bacterium]